MGAFEEHAYEQRILLSMDTAITKAYDALSRYKFLMFGYHAAQWVTLNRLLTESRPNPFRILVKLSREFKNA
jgi:hypothetical protein